MVNILADPLFSIYIIGFVLILVFALSAKFILFAVKLQFMSMRHKKNIGLIFLRGIGNNFTFPKVVVLNKNIHKDKTKMLVLTRDQFREGLFWGFPYMFADTLDAKTSIGLYKHQCNENGEPLYYNLADGTQIPVLHEYKNSVSIDPDTLMSVIVSAALTTAIEDFLKKNKLLLIVCGAAALFAFGAVFFGYNNQNTLSLCLSMINNVSMKADSILLMGVN